MNFTPLVIPLIHRRLIHLYERSFLSHPRESFSRGFQILLIRSSYLPNPFLSSQALFCTVISERSVYLPLRFSLAQSIPVLPSRSDAVIRTFPRDSQVTPVRFSATNLLTPLPSLFSPLLEPDFLREPLREPEIGHSLLARCQAQAAIGYPRAYSDIPLARFQIGEGTQKITG